jgi:succinate dehydrogenase/fumarate reductase flavoprotein subunit
MRLGIDVESTADVLIVGYGAAGAAAALRAAELGGSALILERYQADEHTPSTKMSGGLIMGVRDVEPATTYLDRCAGGLVPVEVSHAWAEKASDLVDWLDRQGTDLSLLRTGGAEHPSFKGAEAIEVYCQSILRDGRRVHALDDNLAGTGGAGHGDSRFRTGRELFAALHSAVSSRRQVGIVWGARGQRLLQDAKGRVVALEAVMDGRVHTFLGRRAIILSNGGFEFDEPLKTDYFRAAPVHFYGNPANTGDGVRMAQQVGADLWHMTQLAGRAVGHFQCTDGTWRNFVIYVEPGGYVITDKHGRRFANEQLQAKLRHDFYYELLTYDSQNEEYPRVPCYWFFDQSRLGARPLTSLASGVVGVGLYEWSPDNRRELEMGWIHEGTSIADVARKAGVGDPERAAATVAAYNRICADPSAIDPHGRPRDSLLPLTGPPFYCVTLYPGGSNTSGGPRRNEHAQILDAFGVPIPALYGAGELGQAIGLLYPADGSNLSEAFCFGQLAVEHALG